MSRNNSLFKLPGAADSVDRDTLERAVQALAGEARSKRASFSSGAPPRSAALGRLQLTDRLPESVQDLLFELPARRKLSDLFLPRAVTRAVKQLLIEQDSADLLQASGLDPRHTVLLVGPPGNGKTSLAEAIARQMSVPFLTVRYDGVVGSYLGETATRLRRIIDYAASTPCVLFFDEFDAIGKERGDVHETGEIKRVVSSLLMQLDALPSYTVVICATNHPELLDRAVWRRFEVRLNLPLPTKIQLEEFYLNFEKTFDAPLGLTPKAFSDLMQGVNFSEVEKFLLDVRRRLVLSRGDIKPQAAVAELVAEWVEQLGLDPARCEGRYAPGISDPSNPPGSTKPKVPRQKSATAGKNPARTAG